jgi:hypothetical protein
MSIVRTLSALVTCLLLMPIGVIGAEQPPAAPVMSSGNCPGGGPGNGPMQQGCGGQKPGHRGKGQGGHKAMRHANPMPNLMMVIRKHGDQLNLSEAQSQELAAWRQANMERMHARAERVIEMERQLADAALAGAPKSDLMGMANQIFRERSQIIAIKADCRDNLARILSLEQMRQVIEIYRQSHG